MLAGFMVDGAASHPGAAAGGTGTTSNLHRSTRSKKGNEQEYNYYVGWRALVFHYCNSTSEENEEEESMEDH